MQYLSLLNTQRMVSCLRLFCKNVSVFVYYIVAVNISLIGKTLEENISLMQQEGQHPLTGQRAANFRLLANQ